MGKWESFRLQFIIHNERGHVRELYSRAVVEGLHLSGLNMVARVVTQTIAHQALAVKWNMFGQKFTQRLKRLLFIVSFSVLLCHVDLVHDGWTVNSNNTVNAQALNRRHGRKTQRIRFVVLLFIRHKNPSENK